MNETKENQKIIELKRKINNDDFHQQVKTIKEQNKKNKLSAPKKKKRKLNLINLVFSIFVMYFLYTAFNQYQVINNLNKEIAIKSAEKAEIEKKVQELKQDFDKINDEEALLELIEKMARNQYKMVKPNEIIYIDKNKNNNKFINGLGFTDELLNE